MLKMNYIIQVNDDGTIETGKTYDGSDALLPDMPLPEENLRELELKLDKMYSSVLALQKVAAQEKNNLLNLRRKITKKSKVFLEQEFKTTLFKMK